MRHTNYRMLGSGAEGDLPGARAALYIPDTVPGMESELTAASSFQTRRSLLSSGSDPSLAPTLSDRFPTPKNLVKPPNHLSPSRIRQRPSSHNGVYRY
jgi:hypothetical protein